MASAIQLPIFKGAGSEDPEKFWFVSNSVWNVQRIMNDDIKKAVLVSTLQDRALTWYVKYSSTNLMARIMDIYTELKKEFSWPKSESQLVVGFKEITMKPSETPWEVD